MNISNLKHRYPKDNNNSSSYSFGGIYSPKKVKIGTKKIASIFALFLVIVICCSLVLKMIRAADDELAETWTSQHLLDCKSMPLVSAVSKTRKINDISTTAEDGSMFVTTKTDPPFQMNIHDPTHDAVSKEIYKNGCWECGHLQGMLTALSQYPGSYFLDVGGNIGMWSLAAAAANKETFTIEPSPENYQKICQSVNQNSFHDWVHLLTIAATTKPETFTLNIPVGNKGGTSVSVVTEQQIDAAKMQAEAQAEGGAKSTTATTTIIKGYSIDSLNLPTDRPVVMKVDVEGHELQALLGAMEFLKRANIIYAMMELRPNLGSDPGWNQIFDILISKGLEPFRVDNGGVKTKLEPENISEWKHAKHPKVRYYDVVWQMRNA